MAIKREQLQCFDFSQNFYKNVTFRNVRTTNDYRKERPYRIFEYGGQSAVTITFGLSGAENVSKIILSLNHCRTTTDGVVDIAVNGTTVIPNMSAPRDDFRTETFNLDSCYFKPESNVLTIQLSPNSPGPYWLSDATIDVEMKGDETEDEIDRNGRNMFVHLKKVLVERRNTIENLRKIADDLDKLHLTINKVKAGGVAASLGGWLFALGGAALEIISAGTSTPITAGMEATGYSLLIGGTVVDTGASAWEAIENQHEMKQFNENIAEDRKYSDNIAFLDESLRSQVASQQDLYRNKYSSLAGASVSQLVTARLMMSVTNMSKVVSVDVAKTVFKDGFTPFVDVTEVAGLSVMKTISRSLPIVGVALTTAELMKNITEISRGSPSKMATNVRKAADQLEDKLLSIENFLQNTLTFQLENLNKELRSSNLLSASKVMSCLPIFDGINSRYGSLNMSWLNNWNNFESMLQPEQLSNLINALNQIYQELEETLKHRQNDPIHLVIVAHGSVGVPGGPVAVPLPGLQETSIIPSQMCFATEYLSSVTFYQPWGVLIDALANYGVVSGSITPGQTQFHGVGHPASIPNSLTRFNVLHSGLAEMIPNVWCNPINDNDESLAQLLELIRSRGTTRPYIWWRANSMPSFFFTALASIAAMLLSIGSTRIVLHIHHAQCLNWPLTTTIPPLELTSLNQYYNAIAETYWQPFKMTIRSN